MVQEMIKQSALGNLWKMVTDQDFWYSTKDSMGITWPMRLFYQGFSGFRVRILRFGFLRLLCRIGGLAS